MTEKIAEGYISGTRNLAAYRVKLFLVEQDWQRQGVVVVGLVKIKGGVPAQFVRIIFGRR